MFPKNAGGHQFLGCLTLLTIFRFGVFTLPLWSFQSSYGDSIKCIEVHDLLRLLLVTCYWLSSACCEEARKPSGSHVRVKISPLRWRASLRRSHILSCWYRLLSDSTDRYEGHSCSSCTRRVFCSPKTVIQLFWCYLSQMRQFLLRWGLKVF